MRIKYDEANLISGISKNVGKTGLVLVMAAEHKGSELIAVLQKRLDLTAEAADSRAAWRKAAKAKEAYLAESDALVLALRQQFELNYRGDDEKLKEFGLVPKAPKHRTAEEKADAVKKARATRAAHRPQGAPTASPAPSVPAASPAPTAPAAPPVAAPVNGTG